MREGLTLTGSSNPALSACLAAGGSQVLGPSALAFLNRPGPGTPPCRLLGQKLSGTARVGPGADARRKARSPAPASSPTATSPATAAGVPPPPPRSEPGPGPAAPGRPPPTPRGPPPEVRRGPTEGACSWPPRS